MLIWMEIDFINNHFQQSEAMYAAGEVFQEVAAEYAKLSGREYPVLDLYKMEDAEVAVFMLNSAAEQAKDVVDKLTRTRNQGWCNQSEHYSSIPSKRNS